MTRHSDVHALRFRHHTNRAAGRIGLLMIDRRRRNLVVYGETCGDHLQRRRARSVLAQHGFCRVNGHRRESIAERVCQRQRLKPIVEN